MDTEKIYREMETFVIFERVFTHDLFICLNQIFSEATPQFHERLWANVLIPLVDSGLPFDKYLLTNLLADKNPISKRIASGKTIPPTIEQQAKKELQIIRNLVSIMHELLIELEESLIFRIADDMLDFKVVFDYEQILKEYKKGYGVYRKSTAYKWAGAEGLQPIMNVNPIRLKDLKNYCEEREEIIENTKFFLKGLPAGNVLLYGDRGTGKSSTVHAILNEFSGKGLRLVEVSKSDIRDIPLVLNELSSISTLKFILFLDDLSFNEGTDDYSELKAALEGSIYKMQNVIIYATTNRRHLIKESSSERADEVHFGDAVQEKLSLSDRFGLSVTFINPSKKEFLEILKGILQDYKVKFDDDFLEIEAERYALKRGGRSPRAARQLADYLLAKSKA